jgi:hypothetical protein
MHPTGLDRMLPRYAYHRPFTVKVPDKCAWQNGLNPNNKGSWSGTQMGARLIKTLVLGYIDGAV